jgi:O-antigen ligase
MPAGGLMPWPAALSLLEWALLAAAIALWVGGRTYSPLIVAGSGLVVVSWAARWLRTRSLTRPTPADLPLILFLISAVGGLWAAPSQAPGLVRLFLFIGAACLYFGVVNASGAALNVVCAVLTAVAAAVGVYFVTQNPWAEASVKFGAVHQIGRLLNGWAPDLGAYKPHPNVVAALLGVLAPVAALQTLHAVREAGRAKTGQTWLVLLASAAGLAVISGALLMTESRGTWLGLAGAAALALWWWLSGLLAGGFKPNRRVTLFSLGVLAGIAASLALIWWQAGWVTRAFGALPGPNSAISRVEVFRQVWRLAQDMPFTGGGLDAFPALYSTFVLDIPFLLLTHAHNAYLNLFVEQGLPGGVGFVLVLGTAAVVGLHYLANERAMNWRRAAGLLGLAVVAIQSLGDASLVASRVIPIVFVPAALALAEPPDTLAGTGPVMRWARWLIAAVVILMLVVAAVFNRQIAAAWKANLGSVAFDRAQLANWPTNEWPEPEAAAQLAAAENELRQVLTLDPDNQAARLRLGVGAMTRWDFEAARDYLERAYLADPAHRGLTKYLAYTYTWLGEHDRAKPLLAALPEAAGELEVYSWWWGQHGRSDLAERARHARARLRLAP